MRTYSEDAKVQNIYGMLNTFFADCDIRSTTYLDAKVQMPVIKSARDIEMIKMEPDGNGGFRYRITPKDKKYRDSKV